MSRVSSGAGSTAKSVPGGEQGSRGGAAARRRSRVPLLTTRGLASTGDRATPETRPGGYLGFSARSWRGLGSGRVVWRSR
jgi:hypothetical protein